MLRQPHILAALEAKLSTADRVVLLGDSLELRQSPPRQVISAAAPVLQRIGAALGPGGEAVIVPGNHDHRLAASWLERRAREADAQPSPLGLASTIDWREGEMLAEVARRLRPASASATYPGIWLREDLYATHGHYGDRHTTVPMLERLAAGVMARSFAEPTAGPRRAEDYEAILAPIYAWLDAIAQSGARQAPGSAGASVRAWRVLTDGDERRGLRRRALVAAFPVLVAAANRCGLGPLRADVSGPALRRAGLRALGEVIGRLGVRATHVIFGHTHRAGPLEGDDRGEWTAASGPAIVNTGSWVSEPAYVRGDPWRSPYRPGFCAILEDRGAPELVNLLDAATGK